jgi:hypothetical protein
MADKQLTLQESLRLLEITNLDGIKESDLARIRRKAQKRWHPDAIAYAKPPARVVKRYEQNFVLIDVAIAVVRAYLKGDLHSNVEFSKNFRTTRTIPPEEKIRQNAYVMQATLRSNWSRIKKIGYKLHEETEVLSEGFCIKDLLEQDLKDNVPVKCIISLFNGSIVFLVLSTVLGLLTDDNVYALSVVYGIWGIQALSCVVGFLPLSGFWLPPKVGGFITFFINVGIFFQSILIKSMERCSCLLVIAVPTIITSLFAHLTKWIVLYPIYGLVGLIVGEHRIGKTQRRIRYYAGLADWYIEELINGNPSEFSTKQLFDLSHLYSELKDVRYA